jgi:hypothetical protein
LEARGACSYALSSTTHTPSRRESPLGEGIAAWVASNEGSKQRGDERSLWRGSALRWHPVPNS